MVNVLGIILAFGVIVYYEAPGLIKRKLWRELAVLILLVLTGLTLSILRTTGVLYKCWVDLVGPVGGSISRLVGLRF
ncbi:MAG: hypothetical protein GX855_10480 [Firmicutes bacterium]|nr:hypothetical protein [Bacillota bacterium]